MRAEIHPTNKDAPAPHAGEGLASRVQVAAVAAMVPLTCLWGPSSPQPGLDPSWRFGLHAAASGFWGDPGPLHFTYGVLGFLTVPELWTRRTFALSVLFILVLQALLCWTLLRLLLRVLPLPTALPLAGVLALLAPTEPSERGAVLVALATGLPGAHQLSRRALLVLAVVTGLLLQTKFTLGAVAGGALLLLVLVAGDYSARQRLRRAVLLLGVSALSSLAVFSLLTGEPTAFLSWLRSAREISSGYVAMATSESDPRYAEQLPFALLAMAVLMVLLVAALHHQRNRNQWASALVVVLVAYLALREGFTREDAGHVSLGMGALVLLPFALRLRRAALGPAMVSGALLITAVADPYPSDLERRFNLGTNVRESALRVEQLIDSKDVQRPAKSAVVREDALSAELVRHIGGHSVQVDPWESAVVWAYALRWQPVPTWQLYSAYTPWLDDQNAAALDSAEGPERVLRLLDDRAIDGRFPAWESPAYRLEQVCGWKELARDPRWQLLADAATRCGRPIRTINVSFRAGEEVAVPAPTRAESVMVVRAHLNTPMSYRLQALVFKPLRSQSVRVDGAPFRLVVANASQPLLLRTPFGPAGVRGEVGTWSPLDVRTVAFPWGGTLVFEELVPTPAGHPTER